MTEVDPIVIRQVMQYGDHGLIIFRKQKIIVVILIRNQCCRTLNLIVTVQ